MEKKRRKTEKEVKINEQCLEKKGLGGIIGCNWRESILVRLKGWMCIRTQQKRRDVFALIEAKETRASETWRVDPTGKVQGQG